jgi:nitroreductase
LCGSVCGRPQLAQGGADVRNSVRQIGRLRGLGLVFALLLALGMLGPGVALARPAAAIAFASLKPLYCPYILLPTKRPAVGRPWTALVRLAAIALPDGARELEAVNETLQTLHSLRTTRAGNFSDRPVSEADLETILQASVRAATASGRQSYSIIVVDDAIKKEMSWPGDKVLLYLADCNRMVDLANHIDQPLNPGHLVQFLTAVIDTSLALQTAIVAARSLGLGTFLTNRIYQSADLPKARQLLGLPQQYCFPVALLCLGYPLAEPAHLKGRLAGPGVIHRGRYARLSPGQLDVMVGQYDDPANHFALNDAWREQGFEHYLQWLLVTWSKMPGAGEARRSFVDVLHSTGFLGGAI